MANYLRVGGAEGQVGQELGGRFGRYVWLQIHPGGDAHAAHEGAERLVGDLRIRVGLRDCDKNNNNDNKNRRWSLYIHP